VDTNTIYRVGSITKLITNLMLFQLRDQGKLSLDNPVSVRTQLGLGGACLTTKQSLTHTQQYVPELTWPTPFKNNPGITWRSLAGQIRLPLHCVSIH
jgi:hypothetical protein